MTATVKTTAMQQQHTTKPDKKFSKNKSKCQISSKVNTINFCERYLRAQNNHFHTFNKPELFTISCTLISLRNILFLIQF